LGSTNSTIVTYLSFTVGYYR